MYCRFKLINKFVPIPNVSGQIIANVDQNETAKQSEIFLFLAHPILLALF